MEVRDIDPPTRWKERMHIHEFRSGKGEKGKKEKGTYHPIATFFHLVRHEIDMNRLGLLEILVANCSRQLRHARYRVRLQQVAVVEVVKEDVEPLLRVDDMGFEGGRGARFHTLHVLAKDLVDGACGRGNVAAVASGMFGGGSGGGRCWLGTGLWWRP